MSALHTTAFAELPVFRRGKVRDVYDLGNRLLMIATDRISAFDVVMAEAVPDKGRLLTSISLYWFEALKRVVRHHVLSTDTSEFTSFTAADHATLRGRTMIVQKTRPLPIECVVRGYLAGSGWKEYSQHGTVCGIPLPPGLLEGSQLPEPIFTPATKAETGHDENISFDQAAGIVSPRIAEELRAISVRLYSTAASMVQQKGLLLADTKFEFGLDERGDIILIDEALTPDSSRYWLASEYRPGHSQHNFDKQVLRDWLETLDWNKQAPAPALPEHVIMATRDKYIEAFERITGRLWATEESA
ncbi:MAG: phosphoribosylaminoimidazolesuccinocarboxamide synthase [Candidatus Kapabacteria bacterium]|jgi:phosphoribosylaminoimidazole-succinocarboxamide synthase|nr:phosphoribosylaminoimidazolesuccinocarboxamide synthase [Candidatus Kapabacteria bacterium]